MFYSALGFLWNSMGITRKRDTVKKTWHLHQQRLYRAPSVHTAQLSSFQHFIDDTNGLSTRAQVLWKMLYSLCILVFCLHANGILGHWKWSLSKPASRMKIFRNSASVLMWIREKESGYAFRLLFHQGLRVIKPSSCICGRKENFNH